MKFRKVFSYRSIDITLARRFGRLGINKTELKVMFGPI